MKDQDKIGETEKNIRRLFENIPNLKNTLKILEKNEIKYGIFAGACVYLLTSGREPTDVDILVADEDFERLSNLFKGLVVNRKDKNVNSDLFYLDDDNNLEFVSRLDFIVSGMFYPIRLTPLAWKNVSRYVVDGVETILLNPVDTVLEKAISPRGEEVGKHDLEDINALMNTVDIDKEYLQKRVKEMKAEKRVTGILRKYNII
jgi:hypothetical protein